MFNFSSAGALKSWNFYNNYFRYAYPDMYGDMTGQSTAPAPAPAPVAPAYQPPKERERDEGDLARNEAWRLQDRIAGKTTIQGQVVGCVPDMPVGQAGMSGVVSKFLTGVESEPNMLSSMGLGMFNKLNEKSHQVNINALVESKGKSGGVGMVWNPKTGWHSVSLGVKDLGESSEFVQGITGETNLVKKSLTGNIPNVFVYNGKVYNMKSNTSRQEFMTALQADANSVYQSYTLTTPDMKSYMDDLASSKDFEGDTGTIIQSDDNNRPKGTPWRPTDADIISQQSKTGRTGMIDEYDDGPNPEFVSQVQKDKSAPTSSPEDRYITTDYQDYQDENKARYKELRDKTDIGFGGDDYGFNTGGGVNSGFIGGRTPFEVTNQESIADNIALPAEDGGFVMNAPAIQERPEEFQTMLADAGVNINTSAGEYYFKPEDVAKIGLDKLQAFNNRGKPEVSNRIARSGGFIDGYAAGDEVDDLSGYGEIPDDFFNKVSDFASRKRQRGEIDTFINELTDQEALSLLFLTETYAGKDPIEHMQRIGDVVLNRASSSNDDFKMQNTIKDVLTFKKSRKKGNKPMYQFDGLEPTSLHKRLTEVTKGGARHAFKKAYAAAENTLNTDPDLEQYRLPKNVLYYQKIDPTEDNWMDNNPLLAPLHQFGDHMFYEWFPTADENLFPVREYP